MLPVLGILSVIFAQTSLADVEVKYKSSAEMATIISMKMEGTENIKGDKSHSVISTKVDGGMMGMLGHGGPREDIRITRLDKGIIWELDPEKKTYKESSLESLKADLDQAEETPEEETAEDDEYVWSVEITDLEGTQKIAGYECRGVLGRAIGVRKDGRPDTAFITYEQWLSEAIPGMAEVEAYNEKYSRLVGVDDMWSQENMASMLRGYGTQFEELSADMSTRKGYPLKTVVTIESVAPASEEQEADEEADDASGMAEMMKKMFKGNQGDENAAEAAGRIKVFSMTNEVISVAEKAADDGQFEVPSDYTKK
jgi:hypothetical protein